MSVLAALVMTTSPGLRAQESAAPPQDWRLTLGRTVRTIRQRVPTVSRVVFVTDEQTYLNELGRWTLDARWPVLFEDDVYAPMFIRRFQPAEILLADPLPDSPDWGTLSRADRESRIRSVIDTTWTTSTDEDANPAPPRPAGLVLTSLNDPAWCAAVALAADRGQPLGSLEGGYAGPSAALPHDRFTDLAQKVERAVKDTGRSYHKLGDDVDAVTIARSMAGRYRSTADPESDLLATTDGLCRNADGTRWAVTGWLFGTREFTVYQAMCSIFLTHHSSLLFNTYPQSEPWNVYGMSEPAQAMRTAQFSVRECVGSDAQLAGWHGLRPEGLRSDLVMVNTKGMRNWAAMNGGTRAYAQDMPVLDFPTAVYFIHSWSAMLPDKTDTIAGRWLNHGAYAYVGSMSEPYLQAFLPPRFMTARVLAGMPFLVAARQTESKPWKVNTIGDPLFTVVLPQASPGRLDPGTCPLEDDTLTSLTDLLPSHATLSAFCRLGSIRDVLDEAQRILDTEGPDALSALELDMIWARVVPELDDMDDPEVLHLLARLIRKPHDFVDAARLARRYHQLGMDDEANKLVIAARPTAKDGYSGTLLEKALTQ